MTFKVLSVVFAALLTARECDFAEKLNVAVFYESLCPDSIRFINEQLQPSWPEIAPYVNLQLIPFGKSQSINGGEEFKCQHGPKECVGNKLQSCALSGLADPNAQMHFIHCFMNTFSKGDDGQTCAAQVGLNYEFISQCYQSQSGIILQLQAEEVTKTVAPKFVPTIVYNGVFNQQDQDASLNNFKGVICKYLGGAGICGQQYRIQI